MCVIVSFWSPTSLAITLVHLSFGQNASFGVQVRDIRIIINIDDIVLIKSCGAYVIPAYTTRIKREISER